MINQSNYDIPSIPIETRYNIIQESWHKNDFHAICPLCTETQVNSSRKGAVMQIFDFSFGVSPNKDFNKGSHCEWFNTSWRQCDVDVREMFASDRWKDRRHDGWEIPDGWRGIFEERWTGNATTPWRWQMELGLTENNPWLLSGSFGKARKCDIVRLWSPVT